MNCVVAGVISLGRFTDFAAGEGWELAALLESVPQLPDVRDTTLGLASPAALVICVKRAQKRSPLETTE